MKKTLLLLSTFMLPVAHASTFSTSTSLDSSPCNINVNKGNAVLGIGDGEGATLIEVEISASNDFTVTYDFDLSELKKVGYRSDYGTDVEIRFKEQNFHSQFSQGIWLPLQDVMGKREAHLPDNETGFSSMQLRLVGGESNWLAGHQIVRFTIDIEC